MTDHKLFKLLCVTGFSGLVFFSARESIVGTIAGIVFLFSGLLSAILFYNMFDKVFKT